MSDDSIKFVNLTDYDKTSMFSKGPKKAVVSILNCYKDKIDLQMPRKFSKAEVDNI
jgi:hypothetical protein